MGHYTELKLDVALEENTPEDIIAILEAMIKKEVSFTPSNNHPLFSTSRWRRMFGGASSYFDASPIAS